jgi:peroxiredoxin
MHENYLKVTNKIKIGDKAPDFKLPDTDLKPRSLSDFLGSKVVLAFFVAAFASVCTKEMCAFRDSSARLINLGAKVIGISVNDPFTNKAFAEKNRLFFPVLSDYKRKVIKSYGVEAHHFMGLKGFTVAQRSIFILDQKGVIRYVWTTENPEVEPNYNEIEQTLKEI